MEKVDELRADGFRTLVLLTAIRYGKILLRKYDKSGDVIDSSEQRYAKLDVDGNVFYAVDGVGLLTGDGFEKYLDILVDDGWEVWIE